MERFQPSETREYDFDGELAYVIWDYYYDQVGNGSLSLQEAVQLYEHDMQGGDHGSNE